MDACFRDRLTTDGPGFLAINRRARASAPIGRGRRLVRDRDVRESSELGVVNLTGLESIKILEAHDQRTPFVRIDAVLILF
jgi:hypothetical protein